MKAWLKKFDFTIWNSYKRLEKLPIFMLLKIKKLKIGNEKGKCYQIVLKISNDCASTLIFRNIWLKSRAFWWFGIFRLVLIPSVWMWCSDINKHWPGPHFSPPMTEDFDQIVEKVLKVLCWFNNNKRLNNNVVRKWKPLVAGNAFHGLTFAIYCLFV